MNEEEKKKYYDFAEDHIEKYYKKLLEKYEDAINGKVTDDDLGSLNFIEPELYKPLDTSS